MPALSRNAVALLPVCFALLLLIGCKGSESAATSSQPPDDLTINGTVFLPDSTAVFGAEISTEPPSQYVSTDEQGQFWITLPQPGTYTFIAMHPDPRYRDMVGRTTEVPVTYEIMLPPIDIMLGRTQTMPLLDVDERANPAVRRGKKRTGR